MQTLVREVEAVRPACLCVVAGLPMSLQMQARSCLRASNHLQKENQIQSRTAFGRRCYLLFMQPVR